MVISWGASIAWIAALYVGGVALSLLLMTGFWLRNNSTSNRVR